MHLVQLDQLFSMTALWCYLCDMQCLLTDQVWSSLRLVLYGHGAGIVPQAHSGCTASLVEIPLQLGHPSLSGQWEMLGVHAGTCGLQVAALPAGSELAMARS